MYHFIFKESRSDMISFYHLCYFLIIWAGYKYFISFHFIWFKIIFVQVCDLRICFHQTWSNWELICHLETGEWALLKLTFTIEQPKIYQKIPQIYSASAIFLGFGFSFGHEKSYSAPAKFHIRSIPEGQGTILEFTM